MSEHTPGPWKWEPTTHTIRSGDKIVAALRFDCGDETTKEGQANAALIASAPALRAERDEAIENQDARRESLAQELRGVLKHYGAKWVPDEPSDLIGAFVKLMAGLTTERDEARAELRAFEHEVMTGRNAQHDALTAQRDELAAALEPFAEMWEHLREHAHAPLNWRTVPVQGHGVEPKAIEAKHLIAATELLARLRGEGEG